MGTWNHARTQHRVEAQRTVRTLGSDASLNARSGKRDTPQLLALPARPRPAHLVAACSQGIGRCIRTGVNRSGHSILRSPAGPTWSGPRWTPGFLSAYPSTFRGRGGATSAALSRVARRLLCWADSSRSPPPPLCSIDLGGGGSARMRDHWSVGAGLRVAEALALGTGEVAEADQLRTTTAAAADRVGGASQMARDKSGQLSGTPGDGRPDAADGRRPGGSEQEVSDLSQALQRAQDALLRARLEGRSARALAVAKQRAQRAADVLLAARLAAEYRTRLVSSPARRRSAGH